MQTHATPALSTVSGTSEIRATTVRVQARVRARGIPLGFVLLGILVGQAVIVWIGFAALRSF